MSGTAASATMLDAGDLTRHLDRSGVPHSIVDPGAPTPTCETAATALGVRVDQIIKSIVFATDAGDRVIAVLPGDVRGDARKVAAATGIRGWRLARPDEVLDTTGFPVGAVPPFLVPPHEAPMLVDPAVAKEDEVVGGGGAGHLLLRCPASAIVAVNQAHVVDIGR